MNLLRLDHPGFQQMQPNASDIKKVTGTPCSIGAIAIGRPEVFARRDAQATDSRTSDLLRDVEHHWKPGWMGLSEANRFRRAYGENPYPLKNEIRGGGRPLKFHFPVSFFCGLEQNQHASEHH